MELSVGNLVVEIDDDDGALVGSLAIWVEESGYVYVCYKGKSMALHRVLTAAQKGHNVHHKNGNKLDNRRGNLVKLKRGSHSAVHRREREAHFHQWCADNIKGEAPLYAAERLYYRATKKRMFNFNNAGTIKDGVPCYDHFAR